MAIQTTYPAGGRMYNLIKFDAPLMDGELPPNQELYQIPAHQVYRISKAYFV
ncbi:hypothetical protein G9A89_001264 [Geosiphon pyriformis]|nr:hypothetical protein G9A89_001264 [Geosiphon pyriformis]